MYARLHPTRICHLHTQPTSPTNCTHLPSVGTLPHSMLVDRPIHPAPPQLHVNIHTPSHISKLPFTLTGSLFTHLYARPVPRCPYAPTPACIPSATSLLHVPLHSHLHIISPNPSKTRPQTTANPPRLPLAARGPDRISSRATLGKTDKSWPSLEGPCGTVEGRGRLRGLSPPAPNQSRAVTETKTNSKSAAERGPGACAGWLLISFRV